jgi:uncharacterized protein with GYD domain
MMVAGHTIHPASYQGVAAMPKYVVLVNWTDQGIKDVKDTVQRAEQVSQLVQKHGGQMETLLWTQGRYDLVGFIDLPDDETFAAVGLQIGMVGAVRTESLRAFTADEMSSLLQRLT